MDMSKEQPRCLPLASAAEKTSIEEATNSRGAKLLITAPLSLPTTSAVILLVSALMTFLAFWFITLVVTITKSPTLISMLRSTEIILSLVTESVWWGEPPHYLSVLGSLLVTFVLYCTVLYCTEVMSTE